MKFIRNASWTTRVIVALCILGLVLGLIEARPILAATLELLGTKGAALLVLAYLSMVVLLFFPAWWPWWRAHRSGLSQRWLFVLIVWGIAVGGVCTVALVIALPVSVWNVFFAPQFQEMGLLTGRGRILQWISEYWWLAAPPAQAVAAVCATQYLARRWGAVRLAWTPTS